MTRPPAVDMHPLKRAFQIGPDVMRRIGKMTHLRLAVEFLFWADRVEHLLGSVQLSR